MSFHDKSYLQGEFVTLILWNFYCYFQIQYNLIILITASLPSQLSLWTQKGRWRWDTLWNAVIPVPLHQLKRLNLMIWRIIFCFSSSLVCKVRSLDIRKMEILALSFYRYFHHPFEVNSEDYQLFHIYSYIKSHFKVKLLWVIPICVLQWC